MNRWQRRAAAGVARQAAVFTALRTPGAFQSTEAAPLARLIAASIAGVVGPVELLCAVRNREIALFESNRTVQVPEQVLAETPSLTALLGDDNYARTGPSGRAAVLRLLRWVTAGMVHTTGADVPIFKAAIGMALLVWRFPLIETDRAHAPPKWDNAFLAHGVQSLGLVPSDGTRQSFPQWAKLQ